MKDKLSPFYQSVIENEISDDLTHFFRQELSEFKKIYWDEHAAAVLQGFQHGAGDFVWERWFCVMWR